MSKMIRGGLLHCTALMTRALPGQMSHRVASHRIVLHCITVNLTALHQAETRELKKTSSDSSIFQQIKL